MPQTETLRRAALVTGGAKGIGRAICEELARGGANVVLCYAGRAEAAQETVTACEDLGAKALAVQCNVADEAQVKALMDAAVKEFGRIDILVNNAGVTRDGLVMMMKEADFDAVIDTNLKGTFLCMKAVSRIMMKQRYGRIVNLSSVVGLRGNAGQVNYAASKAGVIGMTKKTFPERIITSEPHYGEKIDVDIDTHLTGSIAFANGAVAQICTTFDVHYAPGAQCRFELYGTKGTICVPDPNTFGGPVLVYRPEDQVSGQAIDPGLMAHNAPQYYTGYKEVPLLFDYNENSRALGLSDMCKALRTGRDFRANYQQQHHVLEILTSFEKSSREGRYIPLKTHYTRTAPMQNNPMHGILDD